MRTYKVATAPRRTSAHWIQEEMTWDELLTMAANPATQRESGNLMFGELRETRSIHRESECVGLHRKKEAVVSKSLISLDIDAATPTTHREIIQHLTDLGAAAIIHTTWSSVPEKPRYRVLIPLEKDISPDDYARAVAVLVHQIGEAYFDPQTGQPERFMFRPASPKPGERYWWTEVDGKPLSADTVLQDWDKLPEKPDPRPHHAKRNPFEMANPVGAFNRVYADFDHLIATYDLPYESVGENRWVLAGKHGSAGVVQINDGLVYSHHANDPAGGRAQNAFDLVRIHRFGYLDDGARSDTPVNRLPSHRAMLELAVRDEAVTLEMLDKDDYDAFRDPLEDDGEVPAEQTDRSWRGQLILRTNGSGELQDIVHNRELLIENDPFLRGLYTNLMTRVREKEFTPWVQADPSRKSLDDSDFANCADYLEREYHYKASDTRVRALISAAASRRGRHPIRDYLDSLEWDGTPRLEECLPGVRDHSDYTRMVARKCLVAAVARAYEPGCKWDHIMILYGDEGLGKSWWIEKMARGYMSNLGPIHHKDTMLSMERSWIVVSDEGHSLQSADSDVQKEFITRTTDVFRAPYEREAQPHPRQCVIWGTTNEEAFLKRQKGNRRFLIIHVEESVDFDALTDEEIDQVWAEAVHLYRAGEPLFLNSEENAAAQAVRELYTEEDPLRGLILQYLSRKVPADWNEMDIYDRNAAFSGAEDGFVKAEESIDEVCSLQIRTEVLGREFGDPGRDADLRAITAVLQTIPGWRRAAVPRDIGPYGRQIVYERVDPDLNDLL